MKNIEQVLKSCTIEGNIIKLPSVQLDRKLYMKVAKSLELIGGKWNRKVAGFVFLENPTELLTQITNGEKRNLKKEFQFFGTPDTLADRLVELADLKENDRVLEPSAGQGAIIKSINRKFPDMKVECYELMPINLTFLEKIETAMILSDDFLNDTCYGKYDKIVANPPFSKNQDLTHIRKMYDCLKSGGRLVSMCSKHYTFSSQKKEIAFKEWLEEVNAEVETVDAGSFKDSGTMIETLIIIIINNSY